MDWNDAIPVFLILIGIIMFAFVILIGLQNLSGQQADAKIFHSHMESCWELDKNLTCHDPDENNVVCKCTERTQWKEDV